MAILRIKKKPLNPFADIPDPLGFGQRAVGYIKSLTHPGSLLPGKAYQLDPPFERIIRQIYGPRHPNGQRIVRNVMLLLPRGNRKTTLAATLCLLHAKGPERRPNSQIVAVAADKKQAKLTFNEVAGMLDHDYAFTPGLGNAAKTVDNARGAKIRATTSRIIFPGNIDFEALASDAGTAQGRTPSLSILDEIHVWEKRDPRAFFAAIKAGAAKVPNSLMVFTTTAGAGRDNIAWELVDYARKVKRGEIDDPATLPILFEATKKEDWLDEELWHKVNPGLKYGYPDLEGLRQEALEAQHRPAEKAAFQRFHLNIWQEQSASPFVDMDLYDEGSEPIDIETLKGRSCWIGVDLGATDDLSAVVCAFKDPEVEDGFIILPFFYMPGDNLERRQAKSGFQYVQAVEDGYIRATAGAVTDYRVIEADLRALCERFHVQEIAFDPAYGMQIMANLTDYGYPVVHFRQGYLTFSPAIKTLEVALLAKKLKHGGNPVLRWNFANVVTIVDDKFNKTFSKKRSQEKIDGAVATAMAVARAAAGEDHGSIYDTPERASGLLIW